jgi:hypothetical protein
MIDLFGRLPVHERQYIRHVVAVPGDASAYESGGNVLFRGPVGHPSHFQHEVGHAVDAFRHENFTSSETDIFINAIFKDTCVPDPYSNSGTLTHLPLFIRTFSSWLAIHTNALQTTSRTGPKPPYWPSSISSSPVAWPPSLRNRHASRTKNTSSTCTKATS